MQWRDNKYDTAIALLTLDELLLKVLNTEEAEQAYQLVEEAISREDYHDEDSEDESEYASYDDLDVAFYKINTVVLTQFEEWLKKQET